jgi:hypothetical protein
LHDPHFWVMPPRKQPVSARPVSSVRSNSTQCNLFSTSNASTQTHPVPEVSSVAVQSGHKTVRPDVHGGQSSTGGGQLHLNERESRVGRDSQCEQSADSVRNRLADSSPSRLSTQCRGRRRTACGQLYVLFNFWCILLRKFPVVTYSFLIFGFCRSSECSGNSVPCTECAGDSCRRCLPAREVVDTCRVCPGATRDNPIYIRDTPNFVPVSDGGSAGGNSRPGGSVSAERTNQFVRAELRDGLLRRACALFMEIFELPEPPEELVHLSRVASTSSRHSRICLPTMATCCRLVLIVIFSSFILSMLLACLKFVRDGEYVAGIASLMDFFRVSKNVIEYVAALFRFQPPG